MRKRASLILNAATVLMVFFSWAVMTFRLDDSGRLSASGIGALKYFTVLSNLLMGAASAVYIVLMLRRPQGLPHWAVRLKLAGTVSVAIRSDGDYLTLSDRDSNTAFPIRGEGRPVRNIASLGDYPNEHLVGRGVSAMLARVGGTDYATIPEALVAAQAVGTRRIILLWPATLPRGYAAVTKDGVTYLCKKAMTLQLR